ncbi:T9SS type B sorting domain-containing protein [Ichthyenterobacterium magnum]|uniref:Gliding motility-associated-like protein n=1 Tax=Ichthyenterobacterium magnum TaxID=1230530 RepID=A0A420DCA0_9FLAO|nr:gliding motility-associated C-terminal domain-containing protein [Ichthyenterobacterium magnum]RKE89072.1 gliding motility-associated-like protein [Ichthyenterobacterium magnum]
MNKKITNLTLILIALFLNYGCDDSNDEPEPELETFLCCGENPFANSNVDNLDQTLGEIEAVGMFTPNNDGFNDHFEIQNIEFYQNNTVTIYDLDDNVVFETQSYNNVDETVFPQNPSENAFLGLNQADDSELEFGSYKYKIVIENEETFLEYGYVCFIREPEQANGMSFINCIDSQFDPIIEQ